MVYFRTGMAYKKPGSKTKSALRIEETNLRKPAAYGNSRILMEMWRKLSQRTKFTIA